MRNRTGSVCMILGMALVVAALSLFLWNQRENERAGAFIDQVMPKVMEQIEAAVADRENIKGVWPDPYEPNMREVEIDGYAYVGYLSIPSLELDLPVMSQWDERRLEIAPCRYFGSSKTDNLVIAAHNYIRQFGPIKELDVGDTVIFTDMEGVVCDYTVAAVEILKPSDIKEMTAGDYDLTLFTCTYGGQSRLTVRCQRTD